MGLKINNNVVKTSSKRSKTTQNTANTQENLSQVEYDKSTSKIESSAESEYVTDSDFEPATEDEVENTILDSDVEKTKFSKETPSSLMEKVKITFSMQYSFFNNYFYSFFFRSLDLFWSLNFFSPFSNLLLRVNFLSLTQVFH